MTGNLNESYQLRVFRLDRLREGYLNNRLTEYEFRALLAQEGIADKRDQDAEIHTFRPIGEAARRVVERIRP